MTLSIPQRVIAEKLVFVTYVSIHEGDGSERFYYIAVRARNMETFREALAKPDFDPEDYGIILESGEGKPDAATKERMRMQYGCNHDAAVPLTALTPVLA